MTTIKTDVYLFDELSDDAKEDARNWYRDGALCYDWWDFSYEDAKNIGFEIGGFDLSRHTIEGKLIMDGIDIAKKIKNDHGDACGTYKVAEEFISEVAAVRFIEGADFQETMEYEDKCNDFELALGKAYLSLLDSEYDYLLSEENVDEAIRANEYTFTDTGERFD